jgi:hypothetical protein
MGKHKIEGSRYMMTTEKVDVTDRVYGKLNQGQMNLYLDKDVIGSFVPSSSGNEYNLNTGYTQENDRIIQIQDTTKTTEKYVDCEQGWC